MSWLFVNGAAYSSTPSLNYNLTVQGVASGAGATTITTIAPGYSALVYWNGSAFAFRF